MVSRSQCLTKDGSFDVQLHTVIREEDGTWLDIVTSVVLPVMPIVGQKIFLSNDVTIAIDEVGYIMDRPDLELEAIGIWARGTILGDPAQ